MPTSDLGELRVGMSFDTSTLGNSLKEIEKGMKVVESSTRATTSGLQLFGSASDTLQAKISGLTSRIDLQKSKVDLLKNAYDESVNTTGENSKATQELAIKYNNAVTQLNRMSGELKDTEAELRKQESTLRKVSEATKSFGETSSKIGEGMKDIGGKLTLGLTAPLVAFGGYAIKTASDLSEVQNVVDTTFKGSSKVVDEWSKNAMKSYGLTELQAQQFNGTMGAMLKSMGLTSDQTLNMSTSMVGLAGDLASFYNLDHEEAFNKIRSGISGETEPLKSLGINMSVANLEAYALSQGIKKPYKEMSQGEATQLRYNYLMQATKDAQGDFSKTSGGTANQIRILKGEFTTIAGELGEKLLPYFNKLLQYVGGLIDKFNGLSESQKNMVLAVGGILAVIGPLVSILGSVFTFIGWISTGISWLATAMAEGGALYPAITAISGVLETLAVALGISVGWVIAIGVAIVALIATIIIFRKEIVAWLVEAWGTITKFFSDVWSALPTFFSNLWTSITAFFNELPNRLAYWFGFILGRIIKFFIDSYQGFIDFKNKIPGMIDNIGKFFDELPNKIKTALSNALSAIGTWISNMATKVATEVPKIISSIGKFFDELPDKMLNIGNNIVTGLWNGIKNSWSWLKDKVSGLFGNLVKGIKDGLGISSPSKLFADEVGAMIPAGISVGINANTDEVQNSLNNITGMAKGMALDYSQGVKTMNNGTGAVNNTSTNNDNSFTLIIENFQNNRQQDIENLVQEIDFYRKRMSLATGGVM
jgi:phage-related minor tail protein